ncbi:hypothetical protein [Haloplanus natans]|uniref:hypothetical protein n=1 Tax=Haloplanus natans TaxID=376171 RepID=UPI000677F64E|nr:hypothetical protein [Haloplanus natans]
MEYRPLTDHQKGGISEAIVTTHRYEMYDVFGEWAVDDLREHEGEPVTASDDVRVRQRELEKWDKRLAGDDDEYTWMPDCRYEVTVLTRQTDLGDGEKLRMGPPSYNYLFEVKTGQYGSLKRDQRDVMEAIEAAEDRIIPVRVRVDVSKLPDKYGIHFTRIHGRH